LDETTGNTIYQLVAETSRYDHDGVFGVYDEQRDDEFRLKIYVIAHDGNAKNPERTPSFNNSAQNTEYKP